MGANFYYFNSMHRRDLAMKQSSSMSSFIYSRLG